MTKHTFPHSTSISECEYHADKKELDITFASGGKHKFHDISADVVEQFRTAKSVGNFFHINIRKVYKSSKLD